MEIPVVVSDGIQELITMGVGRAAGMLNRLTGAHVTLRVPEVEILSGSAFPAGQRPAEESSLVSQQYQGLLSGMTILAIPRQSAIHLVTILTGEEGGAAGMDALRIETLLEVGNILISAIMSSLCVLLETRLTYGFPGYQASPGDVSLPPELDPGTGRIISAAITFEVQQRTIQGNLILILSAGSFDALQDRIITLAGREEP